MIIDILCEHTNYWLQSSSAASPPSQEQQEMTSSCTQVVPGKELFAPLEGRCCVVTPSAVSVLGESSSVCPWLHQELFQECHVNLAYFRDVRNPQESKPFAGWPGCSLVCCWGSSAFVPSPVPGALLQDTKTSSTFVPRARILGETELNVSAGHEERH